MSPSRPRERLLIMSRNPPITLTTISTIAVHNHTAATAKNAMRRLRRYRRQRKSLYIAGLFVLHAEDAILDFRSWILDSSVTEFTHNTKATIRRLVMLRRRFLR